MFYEILTTLISIWENIVYLKRLINYKTLYISLAEVSY